MGLIEFVGHRLVPDAGSVCPRGPQTCFCGRPTAMPRPQAYSASTQEHHSQRPPLFSWYAKSALTLLLVTLQEFRWFQQCHHKSVRAECNSKNVTQRVTRPGINIFIITSFSDWDFETYPPPLWVMIFHCQIGATISLPLPILANGFQLIHVHALMGGCGAYAS